MITLLSAFLLATALACSQFSECATEESALALYKESTSFDPSLIKTAVQRSWWQLASLLIEYAQEHNIDITDAFESAVREKNIQIRKLQSFYSANSQKYAVIPPAYQWAEGLEEIDINIKLAHKWDAPATLGCDDIKMNFTENTMELEANCPSTGKVFKLNLQLGGAIVPANCTWSKAAVSRVTVVLKKKERGKWSSLLGLGLRPPRNAHPWYSMQDQLKKKDDAMLEEESVAKRLEERRIEKERRKQEDARMEAMRHRHSPVFFKITAVIILES
ncbi:hypothetical protein WA538_002251 [Blastocystis sp. DL]